MKASELYKTRPTMDVLVYGQPGSGKTTWAARSPRPFIALTEEHGLPSIVQTCPDADVEILHTWADFEQLLEGPKMGEGLKAGKTTVEKDGRAVFSFRFRDQTHTCNTVVLDSLSDLQTLLQLHVSGEEQPSMADWGKMTQLLRNRLHDLRSVPVNVVVLALSTTSEDDKQSRITRPQLFGKIGEGLGQWFSAVGYAAKRTDAQGAVKYSIHWELPSSFVTKPGPGFPPRTENSLAPGQTTLGSLLLATLGRTVQVATAPGDDAKWVTNGGPAKPEQKPQAAPAVQPKTATK